jgi:hypothetical protein
MNNDTAGSLTTLAVCGLSLFLLLLLMSTAAPASRVCLSKSEARHLWPKQHIYWYSKDHCWSNRHGPPRNLKFDPVDPVFPKRAMAKVPEEPKAADADRCCWPQLDTDANGSIVEPPRSFIDRWQDQPWLGRIGQ